MSQQLLVIVSAFIVSAACGFCTIPVIMRYCKRHRLYDLPNERKVHQHAIPRLGGISFLPSMLISFLLCVTVLDSVVHHREVTMSLWSVMFFISLLIIYVVGILDDLIGLPPMTKFIAQIIAASLLPLSSLWINDGYGFLGIHDIPAWLGMPLTVFIVVLIDNAINLIDGIDGLAGGLSFLALAGFLYAFMREGLWSYSVLIAGLMGVLIPYLYFNVHGDAGRGTKIFMGDSGSLTLGFILAFLLIKFASNCNPAMPLRSDGLVLPLTLLIVPMFDVFRVTLYRLRHRQPLFRADKHHIHHKLLAMGLSQRAALAAILALSIAFMAVNILLAWTLAWHITPIVLVDIAVYVVFNLWINWRIARRGKA